MEARVWGMRSGAVLFALTAALDRRSETDGWCRFGPLQACPGEEKADPSFRWEGREQDWAVFSVLGQNQLKFFVLSFLFLGKQDN
jgi:hypothetical protein